MLNRRSDKLELLRIAEAVALEKSIDKELVLSSMESAIQKAALTKFGNDNNIEVIIDRESGDIKIQKVLEIVESVNDPAREIILSEAKTVVSSFHLDNHLARKHLTVTVEGRTLTHTPYPTYLGVTLDRTLGYREHCAKVRILLQRKLKARRQIVRHVHLWSVFGV